ncbi:hypothetical protein [Peribacillus asahii]|uniref:hypothetical protein n=1 Tax=Peribacillus asahii TaxID=228899 RepID=UPI0013E30F29|nr:hypothetical protein [Peribacillus asahii]
MKDLRGILKELIGKGWGKAAIGLEHGKQVIGQAVIGTAEVTGMEAITEVIGTEVTGMGDIRAEVIGMEEAIIMEDSGKEGISKVVNDCACMRNDKKAVPEFGTAFLCCYSACNEQ